jgi:hypothetical protein
MLSRRIFKLFKQLFEIANYEKLTSWKETEKEEKLSYPFFISKISNHGFAICFSALPKTALFRD